MASFQVSWQRVKLKAPPEFIYLNCKICRSARLRRISFRVESKDYLTLKLPLGVSVKEAQPFLERHLTSVLDYMRKLPPPSSLKRHLKQNPSICLNGQAVQIQWEEISQGSTHYEYSPIEKTLLIRILKDEQANESELKDILIQLAKEALPSQTRQWAQLHEISVGKITVRDQRSRWGSCSSTTNISLNWRLILCPPPVCDHIILHELAHRTHMNHSRSFKNLLEEYDPDRLKNEKWIKENGSHIMRLGRPIS